jgi:hypothetical protein
MIFVHGGSKMLTNSDRIEIDNQMQKIQNYEKINSEIVKELKDGLNENGKYEISIWKGPSTTSKLNITLETDTMEHIMREIIKSHNDKIDDAKATINRYLND